MPDGRGICSLERRALRPQKGDVKVTAGGRSSTLVADQGHVNDSWLWKQDMERKVYPPASWSAESI